MKLALFFLGAVIVLPSSALLATERTPAQQELIGSYRYQGSTFYYCLELDPAGTYRFTFYGDMGTDSTSGTWRLRSKVVVLTQTSSHPDASSRDMLRRFVVLADGLGWGLVPKVFTNGHWDRRRFVAHREVKSTKPNSNCND